MPDAPSAGFGVRVDVCSGARICRVTLHITNRMQWLFPLVIAGCSGGGNTARIQVTPNVVAGSAAASARVGSAHTLTSLEYFISGIQLCQDIELMGTGWMNPSG